MSVINVLAGIAVNDLEMSVPWYTQLFDRARCAANARIGRMGIRKWRLASAV